MAVSNPGANPGGGSLTCTTNPVTASSGVATFAGCTISAAGTGYTLSATGGLAHDPATSTAFNVSSGTATQLAFLVQPSAGIAKGLLAPQPVVVEADSFGRVVTSDSSTVVSVAIGTNPGPGVLSCTSTTSVTLVNGVATFVGCGIDAAAIGYTLSATSGVLTPSTTAAFTITGMLVFTTEPGNGTTSTPLATQPVVSVEDALGNVLTGDNATSVSLSITLGTGTAGAALTCTANPVTVVNGVATFAGCQVNLVGTGYKVTATNGILLANGTSSAFAVMLGTPLPTQIFGQDAIDTSIAVSQTAFPTPGSAGAVVLARSDFFSDALAGGPLAAAVGGPLLITPGAALSANLDGRVQAEIQRLVPSGRTVYILGGNLAISPTVDTTLQALGYVVVRLQGTNQFGTAVAIANQLGNPATILEATGLSFWDALSAVPAAIRVHGAILLTNGTSQAAETAAYLAAHSVTRYAIGGPLAAAGADPGASAVYGQDQFGTSGSVAATFFPLATVYGAATGLNYPDALSGGVFMATGGRLGPMLLVNTNAPLPAAISVYLATLTVGTPGFVFGGPLAVGADVLTALKAAVG
jgi:hypothetical protein